MNSDTLSIGTKFQDMALKLYIDLRISDVLCFRRHLCLEENTCKVNTIQFVYNLNCSNIVKINDIQI